MVPSIIGVAGISGSGKSSASQDIAFKLARDGYKVAVMYQDDYFIEKTEKEAADIENVNFDVPERFKMEKFSEDLLKIKNGEQISMPAYIFGPHQGVMPEKITDLSKYDYVLVDGMFLDPKKHLNIANPFEKLFFIDPDSAVALQRRMARDEKNRGEKPEYTIKRWERDVVPAINNLINPIYKTTGIVNKNITAIKDNSDNSNIYKDMNNVVDNIYNQIPKKNITKKPIMVSIMGISGSGKTTLTDSSKTNLENSQLSLSIADIGHIEKLKSIGLKVGVIRQDDYYKNRSDQEKEEDGEINYDTPDAFDMKAFISDIESINDGKTIKKRHYDYKTGILSLGKTREDLINCDVVVAEGMFLRDPNLECYFDKQYFLDVDEKQALEDRQKRDVGRNGNDANATATYWNRFIGGEKGAIKKYILPSITSDVKKITRDDAYKIICEDIERLYNINERINFMDRYGKRNNAVKKNPKNGIYATEKFHKLKKSIKNMTLKDAQQYWRNNFDNEKNISFPSPIPFNL